MKVPIRTLLPAVTTIPANMRGCKSTRASPAESAPTGPPAHSATFDAAWLRWADTLMQTLICDFWAPDGGFFTVPHLADGEINGHSDLLLRLKANMGNTEPCYGPMPLGTFIG